MEMTSKNEFLWRYFHDEKFNLQVMKRIMALGYPIELGTTKYVEDV